jgi:hypothetical protein
VHCVQIGGGVAEFLKGVLELFDHIWQIYFFGDREFRVNRANNVAYINLLTGLDISNNATELINAKLQQMQILASRLHIVNLTLFIDVTPLL